MILVITGLCRPRRVAPTSSPTRDSPGKRSTRWDDPPTESHVSSGNRSSPSQVLSRPCRGDPSMPTRDSSGTRSSPYQDLFRLRRVAPTPSTPSRDFSGKHSAPSPVRCGPGRVAPTPSTPSQGSSGNHSSPIPNSMQARSGRPYVPIPRPVPVPAANFR